MKNIIKYFAIFTLLCLTSGLHTACDDDNSSYSKYPAPVIADISHKEGFPGSIVTITGTEFGSERTERVGRVYFGGIEATEYVSWSNTEIKVKVPNNGVTGKLTLWVWKNHVETTDEFTCIPGARIQAIQPALGLPGETVTIVGSNFQNVDISQIKVDFNGSLGTATSATNTAIDVVIPEGAKTGPVVLTFEGSQTVTGPNFTVGTIHVDDIILNLWDYVTTSGTIKVAANPENYIDGTKDAAYVIYEFTVPVSAKYNASLMASTNQTYATYLNVDIGTDALLLGEKMLDHSLSQQVTKQGWSKFEQHNYGAFILKAGTKYYLKATFLADGTSWVANVNEIKIVLAEDQSVEGIDVEGENNLGYNLYQNDFNNGTTLLPFSASWAWEPNYIKVVDQYAEFYYNQAALDADDRRERRGCELVCGFKTTTDGWYGFKIFLPEGKFPTNVDGSIIAQIFNSGDANTWAGHLKINQNKLVATYRGSAAASAAIDREVGTLTWGKWIPIVLYFKAGRNSKGLIRVWMGDNIAEASPTFDSGPINFAFGNWIDDNTLNGTMTPDNPVADYLGGKWGLYVSSGGDRTIRYDDLKILEGNPIGAFDIVKPGN
ncbi:IPT/TIG domain-containing protein [Dysgonomonas macrotermitis]|nr:IPT/TIG domain-containing protein [Dysgonomonas macrotermitis]